MFMFGTFVSHPAAANGVTIFVNGEMQSYSNEAVVQNGTTLVPLRGIFESLGVAVVWNQKEQTIQASKSGKKIWLKIGSTTAKVNNQNVKLTVPAKVIKGRTLVPLRFIGEALGEKVHWDGSKNTILIGSGDLIDIIFSMTVRELKKFEKGYLLDEFSDIDEHILLYESNMFGYYTELYYYFENGLLKYIMYDFLPKQSSYDSWSEMQYLHRLLHDLAQAQFGKGQYITDNYSIISTYWEKQNYSIILSVDDENYYTSAKIVFYNNN